LPLSYELQQPLRAELERAHDRTMRSNLDIKVQIIEGGKKGMSQLILSGSEPTMHRTSLGFIKAQEARRLPKGQTVTNGRRCSKLPRLP
jgi:hypothetical protein